jgi:protein-disulfide isomerase
MIVHRFALLALSSLLAGGSFSTCRGAAESGSSTGNSGKPGVVTEVELPGVDTSALTPRERREWSAYVSETIAPCADTPVPLAQCVKEKRTCAKCLPAAKFLVTQVREGRTREQAMETYKARFDNDKVKSIDVDGSPVHGPASAPITIVEWADFECPHCRAVMPILDQTVEKFPGKVRLIFKNYPLSIHSHAEPAARAAIAAGVQGKFWEMHHKLFKATALETPDIERYAKDLGLGVDKLKSDMAAEATTSRIEKDKKSAEAVGFAGTPLIFINGREFHGSGDFVADLEEWIRLELELGGDPNPNPVAPPKPAASGSAAPSGSAKP